MGGRYRPSLVRSRPHRMCPQVEQRVIQPPRAHKWRPARIAHHVGQPVTATNRILCRRGPNRLSRLHRPTGPIVRRCERAIPGELLHMYEKKFGRIPRGGGWPAERDEVSRANRQTDRRAGGYDLIQSVVDYRSRLSRLRPCPTRPGKPAAAPTRERAPSSPPMASPCGPR